MGVLITAAEVASIHADLGGSSTYTPHGGSAVTTDVIMRLGAESYSAEGVAIVGGSDFAVILKSAVSRPVRDAAIVYTDPETGATTAYLVDEITAENQYTTTVEVHEV